MIEVAIDQLKTTIGERGPGAYVLTVSGDGRPHAVYAEVGWDGGRLVIPGIGGTTGANATARPHI